LASDGQLNADFRLSLAVLGT